MLHPTRNPDVPVPRLPRARLLVVDDDELIRELHARVLVVAGYEVETAEDGIDALERLAEEPFDLVLTDNYMPRLSGSNLALALRSAGSHIPVVMVSGSLAINPPPGGRRPGNLRRSSQTGPILGSRIGRRPGLEFQLGGGRASIHSTPPISGGLTREDHTCDEWQT